MTNAQKNKKQEAKIW